MHEGVNKSPLVTYDSVATAAETLASANMRPSIRGVIGALGGGSPNAVLAHLNAWKAARPSVKASEVTVDPRIAAIIGEQIRIAVGEATRAAESRAADAAADSEVVADAGRRSERQIEELAGALSGSRDECQQLMGRLEMLTQEFEKSKREASGSIAVVRAEAEASIVAASANAAHERTAAEAALQAVARAELRQC